MLNMPHAKHNQHIQYRAHQRHYNWDTMRKIRTSLMITPNRNSSQYLPLSLNMRSHLFTHSNRKGTPKNSAQPFVFIVLHAAALITTHHDVKVNYAPTATNVANFQSTAPTPGDATFATQSPTRHSV